METVLRKRLPIPRTAFFTRLIAVFVRRTRLLRFGAIAKAPGGPFATPFLRGWALDEACGALGDGGPPALSRGIDGDALFASGMGGGALFVAGMGGDALFAAGMGGGALFAAGIEGPFCRGTTSSAPPRPKKRFTRRVVFFANLRAALVTFLNILPIAWQNNPPAPGQMPTSYPLQPPPF